MTNDLAGERQRAHVQLLIDAGDLCFDAERIAPELGIRTEALIEDGLRLWRQLHQEGVATKRDYHNRLLSTNGFASIGETDALAIECPRCSAPVPVSIEALGRATTLCCPGGHALTLVESAGLSQILAFIQQLCDFGLCGRRRGTN